MIIFLAVFTVKGILIWGSKIIYKWYKEEALIFPGLKVDDHRISLIGVQGPQGGSA